MSGPLGGRTIRRLIGMAATMAALVTIGILATGAPAQAAAWFCPAHNSSGVEIIACIYPDGYGAGNPYLAGNNLGCHNLTGGWNDIASSVRTNSGTGYLFRIWDDANCSGNSVSMPPGDQTNLGFGVPDAPLANDTASSRAVYPPGTW